MASRALSEVLVGDVVGPVTVPVGRDTLVAYANASGDQNPIHQDEAFARSVGLPTSSPTACGRWAPRPPSSPTGPATPAGSWSSAPGSPSRSSCPWRERVVVQGVVKAVDAETGRVTVDVTTTC